MSQQPSVSLIGLPDYSGSGIDPQTHPHRPIPNPATGGLVVDPEIRLKAASFGIDVSFYYSTASTKNSVCGLSRFANVFQRIVSKTDNSIQYAIKAVSYTHLRAHET